ncbi:YihY/virulence factor BrkB family protein [Peribacillus glennii]|uniref:YihY/virulence factor BrkB family protein n=1 Tax=Peribacillus glennii TaxID=2303991 RepID=A0A372LBU4_9BACI|nr:YihY/virulence factor BrkB family protein [Peribacillus glennii]RFU62930.1 YihY/virulence factor BrkB family protein [Peribacillus glennii]
MTERQESGRPSFFLDLINRMSGDDVTGLAAQLAYFFLLSLFPLLLFLVSILPYLSLSPQDILNLVRSYAPQESMQVIERNLNQVMQGNGSVLSFGILATLWSGSNGINTMVRAFNRAYKVVENRHFLVARAMSMILTIAMIFVFVVALLLPVFGRQIGLFFTSNFGLSDEFLHIWNALRWVVSSLVLFFVLTMLYWIAPNKKINCLSVMPGALAATVGWCLVSLGFSFYVEKFGSYTSTYGSLGGIIVLMIWFYLSGFIIIIGGEINAIKSERKKPNC